MFQLSIKTVGLEKAIKAIEAVAPKQLPFILAVALTETARDVEFIVKRAIQSDIDRPRDFTINSVTSSRATKTNLLASVFWKSGGGGTSGGKYLRPTAEGGGRALKRSEVSLQRMGLLPQGFYLVPGEDAKLDSNGNVPGSVYTQMLSALQAFPEEGYVANRTARSAVKRQLAPWFVIKPGSGSRMAPGIYQRLKTKRKLMFAIVKAPKYHVTFPFEGITRRAALDRMPIQFDNAIEKALSTAK